MKYIKPLVEPVLVTLQEMYKNAPVHRLRQRAHIILMSNKRLTINEIALAMDLDRDTISLTMQSWENIGIIGLYDKVRHGRPPIFNDSEHALIVLKIEQDPRQLKKITADIKGLTGKNASVDTIKRIAKKAGLIWKRIKKRVAGQPDPTEYDNKKEKLEELKNKFQSGEINLYFQDESGFSLTPSVPYAWQYRGQTISVPSTRSKQLNVLGFLQPNQNLKSIVFEGNIDSECLIGAIEQLFPFVEKETWFVMDNAPTHKSKKFTEKMSEWTKKDIHLLFLPSYSPELNLIEIVWRFMKYQWLPLSAYQSFKKLTEGVNNILMNYGKEYMITFA